MMDTESFIYSGEESGVLDFLLKEKELSAKAEIEISQVHGPWCWPIRDTTSEGLQERMDKMKKSIYFTSFLGCKKWVVHPVMPYGVVDKHTQNVFKTRETNLSFFRELLKTAKEYEVTICLENMPFTEFSVATPEDILSIVNEIDDENFKICLDTGHVAAFGNLDLSEETRRLGNKIKALHVHDSVKGQDLHLTPCCGSIDWEDFAKALKDINFDGVFSLETSPPRKLPDNLFEQYGILLGKIAKEIARAI